MRARPSTNQPSTTAKQIKCPHCLSYVNEDQYQEHIKKNHDYKRKSFLTKFIDFIEDWLEHHFKHKKKYLAGIRIKWHHPHKI